jgi:hypothetical protein
VSGREEIRQAPFARESLTLTLDEAAMLQPDEALCGCWIGYVEPPNVP